MRETILSRLHKVRACSKSKWIACCPAHDDSSPSLSICETEDGTLLIKCFAGCTISDVMAAIEMTVADLFPKSKQNDSDRMAARQKWLSDKRQAEIDACRLRLDMAKDMRSRGISLSSSDIQTERRAYFCLRQMQEGEL